MNPPPGRIGQLQVVEQQGEKEVMPQIRLNELVAEVAVPVIQVEDPGIIESLRVLPWNRARELDPAELMAMCDYAAELLKK